MLKLTLPDGKVLQLPDKSTGMQAAQAIGQKLAKDALAIQVDGEIRDLSRVIEKDCKIKILTFSDEKGKETFRHSTAHIFAQAVKQLFPEAKPTIGPAVEEGFYYDFDDLKITPEDFPKIETKAQEIINANYPFERKECTLADIKKFEGDNPYKMEMAEEYAKKGLKLTAYKSGDFVDLCEGPHVPSTGYIKAFKLTKIAAAFWKGDSKNKQLARIYGISFPSTKELHEYEKLMEEVEKRDHRKIGKILDLYSFHEEAPGMPFFHNKGMIIWNTLMNFWREEHEKAGYIEVKTPIILNKTLWETSGHWANYRQNMYTTKIDEYDYAIKPMNCPGGMLLFKTKTRSYRDLPIRQGEIGLVHRHELSGVLSGLFRVRCFHQDDAHIFMTKEQIKDEVLGVINLVDKFYKTFGLSYKVELSTRPEKSIGTEEQWNFTTEQLEKALKSCDIQYKINEGDGAFYGPKIDFHIKDAIGRTWQCATIQLDMSLPDRFNLEYEGPDGQKHRPIMIHRVIYGAMERFIGILVEHYAGKFPLWLSPEQVRVLTVADRFVKDAQKLVDELGKHHIRATLDNSAETINKKVRNAQVEQVNYILVYGEKEQQSNALQVRTRDNKVSGPVKTEQFIQDLLKEITEKR